MHMKTCIYKTLIHDTTSKDNRADTSSHIIRQLQQQQQQQPATWCVDVYNDAFLYSTVCFKEFRTVWSRSNSNEIRRRLFPFS